MDSEAKMPGDRHCPRIDTLELKNHIEWRLGQQKAEKYFNLLHKYFSGRITKSQFDKLCTGIVGRENLSLHNGLIRAIIQNACVAKSPPPKDGKVQLNTKVPNGYHSNLQSCKGVFPQSPRKGRAPTSRDGRSKDYQSPLGPHGKPRNVGGDDSVARGQEQKNGTVSIGNIPPFEVTAMEEDEQVAGSPGIHSQSPLRAPLGVCLRAKAQRKVICTRSSSSADLDTCYNNFELPNTGSLRKRLEQRLAAEGLAVSTDCVNSLNNGLDAYMKRLIKPCLDLAALRSERMLLNRIHHQLPVMNGIRPLVHMQRFPVSITDFQVAMGSNPRVLGEDWPVQLEKVYLHASDDFIDG